MAGVNIYSIIGLLVAGTLLFHFSSKEEMIALAIAAVVIMYLLKG